MGIAGEKPKRATKDEIAAARLAILKVLGEQLPKAPVEDYVALLSYMTGELVSGLDQRKWAWPGNATDLVSQNLERGNQAAVAAARAASMNAGNA